MKREEEKRKKRSRLSPSLPAYLLSCFIVSLQFPFSVFLGHSAVFCFFLFTCCHHLSRAPSSLFSHCCFLCTRPPPSVSGSLALLGLTLCHAGGRSVSGCQLAGRLRDLKEKEKDYIREKRLNDRKQKIAY